MGNFAPELAHHWSATLDGRAEHTTTFGDQEAQVAAAQREALEALADRVLAARTVG